MTDQVLHGKVCIALGAERSPLMRAEVLREFSSAVKRAVREDSARTFNHEQLVLLLLELAKNTFDHSTGSGLLELQLPSACQGLHARYRDSGAAYDWAGCEAVGQSSKAGNGINFGLGLAIVAEGAKAAGFTLTVSRDDCATVVQLTGSVPS